MVGVMHLGHKNVINGYADMGNRSSFSALCSVGSAIAAFFVKFQRTRELNSVVLV